MRYLRTLFVFLMQNSLSTSSAVPTICFVLNIYAQPHWSQRTRALPCLYQSTPPEKVPEFLNLQTRPYSHCIFNPQRVLCDASAGISHGLYDKGLEPFSLLTQLSTECTPSNSYERFRPTNQSKPISLANRTRPGYKNAISPLFQQRKSFIRGPKL